MRPDAEVKTFTADEVSAIVQKRLRGVRRSALIDVFDGLLARVDELEARISQLESKR